MGPNKSRFARMKDESTNNGPVDGSAFA